MNEQKIKIVIMIRAERNTDYEFKIVHKDISQYNMQALVTNKIIFYKSQHLHALIGHSLKYFDQGFKNMLEFFK